jgi:hypothetical protein
VRHNPVNFSVDGNGNGGGDTGQVSHDCPNPGGGGPNGPGKDVIGFQCTSGLCVQRRLACDGIKQCDDGSDESESQIM